MIYAIRLSDRAILLVGVLSSLLCSAYGVAQDMTRCLRPQASFVANPRCCTGTNGYFNNVIVNDTLTAHEIIVGDLFVSGTTNVDVTVTVTEINVVGDLTITGSLIVLGSGVVEGDWDVNGGLFVAGDGCVAGNWCVGGDLTVGGTSVFEDEVFFDGPVFIDGDLCVSGSLCADTVIVEDFHVTTSTNIEIPIAVSCTATAELIFTPTGNSLTVLGDALIGGNALFDGMVTVLGDMSVTTSICGQGVVTAAAIVAARANITESYVNFYTNLNRYAVDRSNRNIWDVLANPLRIAGTTPNAERGYATAISGFGNALALGTVGTANSVAIFDRLYSTTGGYWQLTQTLSGSGAFGTAIALSGDANILVVGSPTLNANNGAATIYLYNSSSNTWVARQTLTGAVAGEFFGSAVSISATGEYIAIGAPVNGSGNTGSAYIYHLDTTLCPVTTSTWNLQAQVSAAVGQSGAQFGFSVALSGDGYFLAVGAPTFDDGFVNEGAGYIFGTDGTGTWTQLQGPIAAAAPAASGLFGASVALAKDGRYAAFGEPGSGRVTIYAQRHDLVWDEQGIITPTGASGTSGAAISLSDDGTILAIGEPTGNGGTGRVTIATRFNSSWSQAYTLTPSGLSNGDNFGSALTLSRDGSFLIVGAPNQTGNLGAGYAFQPGCDLIPTDLTITGSTAIVGDLRVNGDLYVTGSIIVDGTVANSAVTPCTICRALLAEDPAVVATTLKGLRPVLFAWRNPELHPGWGETPAGFIAQEVEQVMPHWVIEQPAQGEDSLLLPEGRSEKGLVMTPDIYLYLAHAVQDIAARTCAIEARAALVERAE